MGYDGLFLAQNERDAGNAARVRAPYDRNMPTDMTNRVALVTGANRGLGRGIAEGLARLGCIVAVGEREEHSALETLATIGLAGLKAHSISIDVTDENSVKEAVARVLERNGRLDIVINNAGGHYDDSVRLSGISDSDMLNALDLNLLGAMRVCRAAVPVDRKSTRLNSSHT